MTPISATFFPILHRCVGVRVSLQYGLLESVSCDSQMAQTSTLAAFIVCEEILLHSGPEGSGRSSESSLSLL